MKRQPPRTVRGLEELGRARLSDSFFLRDFLFSETAAMHGLANVPEDPALAIEAGSRLCQELLEPLQRSFGRIAIRGAYRSPTVNEFGNRHGFNCARNRRAAGRHIWDRRDREGCLGAMACIIVPWFADRFAAGADWRGLAWWIHDHLPYSSLNFHTRLAAFNIGWRETPLRRIDSYLAPRGCLTRPGLANNTGDHGAWYADFPSLKP